MNFTTDFTNAENERLYKEFHKKYKSDAERISHPAELAVIQETVRGLCVMEKWQSEGSNGNPITMLRHYSMLTSVLPSFIATYLPQYAQEDKEIVRPEKRRDKWGAFDKWAKEHQGEQYTTDELVEVAGFSYQTALKYISESPLFVKVKKGLWQVANPDKGDEEEEDAE